MSNQAHRYQRPRVQGSGAAHQARIPLTNERRGMLAKVHLARKDLALDDEAYRDVLRRITGTDSSAKANDAALHRCWASSSGWDGRPRAPSTASAGSTRRSSA